VRDYFNSDTNKDGYNESASRISSETRISIEASGSVYVIDRRFREFGRKGITIAHPK